MKRIISLALLFMFVLLLFCSCGTVKEKNAVSVALLKGPTGMGGVYLMEQDSLNKSKNDYSFYIGTSADEILALLTNGSANIAAVPTNYACIIQQRKAADIQIVAVNTLGVLYILEKGESIKSISDLAGKKIIASGQGTAADAVLTKLVNKYFGTEDAPEITYAAEHSEALAQAVTGKYDVVMLPEPFVSNLMSKNAGFRVALNLTEEWTTAGYGELPMGALVATDSFIKDHKDALDIFLKEYSESVDYINNNIEQGAVLVEKYGIMNASVAQAAIPKCNMVCVTGKEMKESLNSFYAQLFDFKPQLIGGAIPEDNIFYKAD